MSFLVSQVISRVNTLTDDHWVVRFCAWLGIPARNVHLVLNKVDKAAVVGDLGVTHFVDNDRLCLSSVKEEHPDVESIYFECAPKAWQNKVAQEFGFIENWESFIGLMARDALHMMRQQTAEAAQNRGQKRREPEVVGISQSPAGAAPADQPTD